jgi:hypothetical protein
MVFSACELLNYPVVIRSTSYTRGTPHSDVCAIDECANLERLMSSRQLLVQEQAQAVTFWFGEQV